MKVMNEDWCCWNRSAHSGDEKEEEERKGEECIYRTADWRIGNQSNDNHKAVTML